MEVLELAAAFDVGHCTGWVLQIAVFIAILTPDAHHGFGDGIRTSRRGPVDRTVFKVHEAALAIRSGLLPGEWEAQPGGRTAQLCIARVDATKERVRTIIW